jgi:hypothetical protein
VSQVEGGGLPGLPNVAGGERMAAAAVAVQVDEAGHDEVLRDVVGSGHRQDRRPVDLHVPGHDRPRPDDPAADPLDHAGAS